MMVNEQVVRHLPRALAKSGRFAELAEVLLSFRFVQEKLGRLGIRPLLADLDLAVTLGRSAEPADPMDADWAALVELRRALWAAEPALLRDGRQLSGQLLGRLDPSGSDSRLLHQLLSHAADLRAPCWLRPLTLSLVGTASGERTFVEGLPAVAALLDVGHHRCVGVLEEGSLMLWDLSSGETLRRWRAPERLQSAAVDASGHVIVAGSERGRVYGWDLASGRELGVHGIHDWEVTGLAGIPGSRHMLSGSSDGTLAIWEVYSGQVCGRLQLPGQPWVLCLAVAGDRPLAVSGDTDGVVRLWDLVAQREVSRMTGHATWVSAVAISADGSCVASADEHGEIRLWDGAKGQCLAHWNEHGAWIDALTFAQKDTALVSAGSDRLIRIWDLPTRQVRTVLRGHRVEVRTVTVTSQSELISVDNDGTVRLWSLDGPGDGPHAASAPLAHSDWIAGIAIFPDGQRAVSAAHDGRVLLWDLERRAVVFELGRHQGKATALAMSADGQLAASGCADGTIQVWELTGLRKACLLRNHTNVVMSLAFMPDGRLVSASHDRTLRVWDVERGVEVACLEGHQGPVVSVAAAPNGRWLVSGSIDNTVGIWSTETFQLIRRIPDHADWVICVVVSADSTTIASGSDAVPRSLMLTDLETGVPRAIWQGHRSWVQGLCYCGGDRRLVSGSGDHTLRLWDVASVAPLTEFTAEAAVAACAATPDGTMIMAGTRQGTMHFLAVEESMAPGARHG